MDSSNVERVLTEQERTIAWLARRTGVSAAYAWRMLHGERPLTPEFRAATAVALGVPESILFANDPEPTQAAS